jgi:hypothetical protein
VFLADGKVVADLLSKEVASSENSHVRDYVRAVNHVVSE